MEMILKCGLRLSQATFDMLLVEREEGAEVDFVSDIAYATVDRNQLREKKKYSDQPGVRFTLHGLIFYP
jgi:hypothetical protein